MIRSLTAMAFGASTVLLASSAFAQDPNAPAPPPAPAASASASSSSTSSGEAADSTGASAALLLGYGFQDAFKLGFGVRAGYTLPMRVYVGGTFIYHLGTSQDLGGNLGSVTVNVFMVGAEGGYDFDAGPVLIRPHLGLGLGVAKASVPAVTVGGVTAGGGSASSSNVYIAPGATLLYPLSPNLAVGVDARFVIISDANAFATYLTGQYHF